MPHMGSSRYCALREGLLEYVQRFGAGASLRDADDYFCFVAAV